MKNIQRVFALCLSLAIVLISPGQASFAAVAEIAAHIRAGAPAGPASGAVSISNGLGVSALAAPSSLSGSLSPQEGMSSVPPIEAAAAVEAKAADLTTEVSSILESVGDVSKAQASRASGLGHGLQAVLSGERFSARSQEAVSINAQGDELAETASSRLKVYSLSPSGGGKVPTPPNIGDNNSGGSGPLWAKLISGLVALTPAAFLGWPLLASGAVFSGSLAIAASLGLASMPFMSDSTPKFLRAVPGVLIGSLGLAVAAGVVGAFSWPALTMGGLVALGGWGFVRFAREGGHGNINDSREVIATFFGALAATAGAGLVMLSPAGWVAAGLTALAYPVSLILLMHLPGWVGSALTSAFHGFYLTIKDVYLTLSSIRRDTVLLRRLEKYIEASLEKSAWNALPLGLLVVLPILAVEAVQLLLAVASGAFLGLLRAPLMLAWGASHSFARDSKATKFLAAWASRQFLVSKAGYFNPYESKLIAYANSKNKAVGLLAASGIRALQLGWLIGVVLGVPALWAIGLVEAFRETGKPYDPKSHDPRDLSIGDDGLAGKIPEEPAPMVASGRFAKVLAAGIGLVPFCLFAGPMVTASGLAAVMVAAAALSIAVMPLMPQSEKFPAALHRAPGTLLTLAGAYTFYQGSLILLVGMPIWGVAALGALALLSGLGLSSLIGKLQDQQTKAWRLDSPEYILGYAGALAVSTSLLVTLIGTGGPLASGLSVAAYVLSPALLYHLPGWLWSGVAASLGGFYHGIHSVWNLMRFWTRETKFKKNLDHFYRHYIDQSFWYGTLMLVPWAISLAAWLGEAAVSLPVGVAIGVLRAPTRFFWGASYRQDPRGSWNQFWAGYHRFMISLMEGSKKASFDPLAAGLAKDMDQTDSVSSRPTLRAAVSFLGVRFIQLYWLLRLAVLMAATPLLVPVGIYKGFQNVHSAEPESGGPSKLL